MGKVPPQAIEFEESILGSLMLETSLIKEKEIIINKDCFYKDTNGLIFEAIVSLNEKNNPIDLFTVSNQLKNSGNLDKVGGPFYISQLVNKVASTSHFDYHCQIVYQKYIQRELIKYSSKIYSDSFDDFEDVSDLIDFSNKELENINKLVSGKNKIQHVKEIAKRCIVEAEKRNINHKAGKSIGITTGLFDSDKMLQGWHNSELTILAARPAMGKTALMLHFAVSAARSGKSVCIYSLEMSDISLTDRLIIKLGDLNASNYRSGKIAPIEWSGIEKGVNDVSELPIYIDDNSMVSINYIKTHSRNMKKLGKCDMIFIDYLQLMDMSGGNKQNREQDVSQTSRAAKIISKELDIPVILLSQLSRNVEQRGGDKRPQLSDLRDSGAIEQDADNVIFIHRPEYYGSKEDTSGHDLKGLGKLIVAKQRNGMTGDCLFRYNESLTQFFDYTEIEEPFVIQKSIEINNSNFYEKEPF